MKKVAIYLRKSREELDESREETLARHERILLDYCASNNLIVANIYREVVSGESIANRPQMQQLLDDVLNNKYDGIVVVEIERLSRGNQIDQAEILEIFKKSNTKIYTLNKIYDLSDENEFDEDFFEFGLFMSRREYKVIKRRLIRGKKQAQKEGYFIGSQTPFGYSKKRQNKGFVLIADDNAKVVQTIYNKYVYDNYTLADLRHYLNNNGIKPTGRVSEWENYRIKRMLANKVYIGYINYDTKDTDNTHVGKHEPIIDDNTFWLAQEKLKSASYKVKRGKELKNPLASLLKCGVCGKTMQRFVRKGKPPIYNCPRMGCSCIMSNVDAVEKKVIDELQEELKGFNYFLDNYGEEIKNKKEMLDKEKQIILSEINKKENMVERCCEMLEEGIYTKEKYLSRVNILEKDLKALKSNLNDLNNKLFDDDERVTRAIPILENVLNEYWNLSIDGRNAILKSIIDKIEYNKNERNANSNKLNQNPNLIDLKIYLKI